MSVSVSRLVTVGNEDPAGPPVHENNVWIVGDENEVAVIDPAHDADAVAFAVDERALVAILLTHGHWDHVRAALDLAAETGAKVYLNSEDAFLWAEEHGDAGFEPLRDGAEFRVGDVTLEARHTPGHTPGSTSLVASRLGCVFTGDTLFQGGPGATRWHYANFDTIIDSITSRLFVLPDDTAVHTGHGPSTTIGTERPHLDDWIKRGW